MKRLVYNLNQKSILKCRFPTVVNDNSNNRNDNNIFLIRKIHVANL